MRFPAIASLLWAAGCAAGPAANPAGADPYERYLALIRTNDERLVRRMKGDPSEMVREGVAVAIGRMGREDLARESLDLLEDPGARVRVAACRMVWLLRLEAAAPKLVRLLREDRDARVRAMAARALGRLPPSADAARALIDALSDADPAVRVEAYEAAARLSGLVPLPETPEGWKEWLKSLEGGS